MWGLRGLLLCLILFLLGCASIIDRTKNLTPSVAPSTNTPGLIITITTPTSLPITPSSTPTPTSLTPTLVPLMETGPWLILG